MDPAYARRLYLQCVRQASRNVQNLEFVERRLAEEALQDTIAAVKKKLKSLERPQRRIPEIEAWKQEFEEIAFRYRFLVLGGGSKLGKSVYAVSIEGRERTLDLTCCGCDFPDLRSHDPFVHKAILFDEASVSLVLRNKRLFQSPALRLGMAGSATHVHAYRVWVHATKMIICSNKWASQLKEVEEEDRKWIQENSLYFHVTTPMWEAQAVAAPEDDPEDVFFHGGFDDPF